MTSTEQDYQQFIENIRKLTGINLSYYKEQQMKRRLTSLREKRGFSNFIDFFEVLEKDHTLLAEFLDRMTINVSEFFRNYSRWQVLQNKVIPALEAPKLKCWSAACSTGEEPYSLAMLLEEEFPNIKAEILATDLDDGVLKRAQEGIYTDRALKESPEKIKKKYFTVNNNLYYVIPQIKGKITFKRHDLLIDKFDSNYDLIICRNVMIYFTDEAKQILYQKFSDALRPGGILFVGSTEQIFNPGQYGLETVDNFFYRKV